MLRSRLELGKFSIILLVYTVQFPRREWFAAGCRSAGNSTRIYINKADGIFVKNARLIDGGEDGLIFYFKSSTIGTPVMCIIFPAISSIRKKNIHKWHIIFFFIEIIRSTDKFD